MSRVVEPHRRLAALQMQCVPLVALVQSLSLLFCLLHWYSFHPSCFDKDDEDRQWPLYCALRRPQL